MKITNGSSRKYATVYSCSFPPALRWRTPHLATAKIRNLRLDQTKKNGA